MDVDLNFIEQSLSAVSKAAFAVLPPSNVLKHLVKTLLPAFSA